MNKPKRIAKNVTIDKQHGDIWIDGFRFPWYVAEEPTIEGAGDRNMITTVYVGILCDNAHALMSLGDDLHWIRELGRQHLAEALEQFATTHKEEAK